MSDAWLLPPVLLPLTTAMALVPLSARPGPARALSLVSAGAQAAVAVLLVRATAGGATLVHRFGDWPVPQGIVFVGDRLAALMLAVMTALALPALWHAAHGEDAAGSYFHSFFHLQLAGLAGAFLTGDLFTLFVFFEVLLIASYALLVHGARPARLRWGVHYVVLNLVGSTFFLAAAGAMYGLLGTLNLAELARRVAALPATYRTPVHAVALLLLVVFALKAAVAPLHLWLAGTYAAAAPAVAALFAIMTKVGVYAVLRVFGVAFGPGAGALSGVATRWLFPAALLTAAVGAAAALGRRDLPHQLGALLVLSVGTLVAAVAPLAVPGVAAGLYYLAHSTLASGAMFLLAASVGPAPAGAATAAAPSRTAGRGRPPRTAAGALFAAGAVAVAGLPPLSGFVGKTLVLASAPVGPRGWWLWGAVLGTSVVAVLALVRSGIPLVWGGGSAEVEADPGGDAPPADSGPRAAPLLPAATLLALLVALTVGAGPVITFTTAAAEQLLAPPDAPGGYVRAVLGATGGR
jgi:multicomponent K+:H+ antiporter subunit D